MFGYGLSAFDAVQNGTTYKKYQVKRDLNLLSAQEQICIIALF